MTPQGINIAIAEFEGWEFKEIQDGLTFSEPKKPHFIKRWISPAGYASINCPNYYEDLNEIHRAELKLGDKYDVFAATLKSYAYSKCYSATAPQRCEALLRTIGKWRD